MRRIFLFGIIGIFFSLGLVVETAQGAEVVLQSKSPIATISCAPDATVALKQDEQNFVFMKGKPLPFTCVVERVTKGKPLSVMLLGKQAFGTATPAASASSFALADKPVTVTLTFSAVYQGGKYQHTFSLIDTATQTAVAKEMTLTGSIKGGEHALFQSIGIKEEKPFWSAPLTLDYALSFPKGQTLRTNPLTIRIAMQDKNGGECAVFVENQAVTQVSGTYTLTLPEQGVCNNVLLMVLKSADGTVLEQRILAIGLPEKKAPVAPPLSSQVLSFIVGLPWMLKAGLIIMGVAAFLFLAYALIRKHRGY